MKKTMIYRLKQDTITLKEENKISPSTDHTLYI